LEEKLIGARLDEETSSVGREQVNKAYHAYREVCIDRDNLKSKLDKMNKDNSESLKVLNEQLQSKEVELLQLRTEVETQQGLVCDEVDEERSRTPSLSKRLACCDEEFKSTFIRLGGGKVEL